MYQKSRAHTVPGAHVILALIVDDEIDRALRDRCADDEGPDERMSRPLRMTIQLALDDLNSPGPEGTARQLGDGFTTLQANTVGEAKTILREAVTRIDEEVARRPLPRRPRKGRHDRPLRVAVHYDLEDLDRAGPLDVNDCLHLFYDGIPPGLQPRNCHPEYAVYDRPHVRREPPPRRRTLFQRMLGG